MLFLDLDGFKRVNDRLGHLAGDRALVAVASRLRSAVRAEDFVARFGGDEFVVVLSDPAALKEVEVLADRLIRQLEQPLEIGGEPVILGVSIGGALAGEGVIVSPDELLSQADSAMYEVKGGGHRRFQMTVLDGKLQA